jgi:hypothetical protein
MRTHLEAAVARDRRRRERWGDVCALVLVVAVVACVYWTVPLPAP